MSLGVVIPFTSPSQRLLLHFFPCPPAAVAPTLALALALLLVSLAFPPRILEWVRKRTRDYPGVKVTDFTSSLADGRAFLAILDDYDPEDCPYDPSDSPSENLRT